MPRSGDSYSVVLKQTHLNWGTYRHTATRPEIPGEAYVPIPKQYALSYDIQLGDLYQAVFADGFPNSDGFASKQQSKNHQNAA